MSETKSSITESQKAAQRKYDQKTKTISIKYTPADMADYDRMDDYLKRTGQSTNGFIKKLINKFFDPLSKEREQKEFYIQYIGEECLDKLKSILDNDEDKYNEILDLYADRTEDEIESALEYKSYDFEEWVDNLEESIEDGNINMEPKKQFSRDIDNDMSNYVKGIYY